MPDATVELIPGVATIPKGTQDAELAGTSSIGNLGSSEQFTMETMHVFEDNAYTASKIHFTNVISAFIACQNI